MLRVDRIPFLQLTERERERERDEKTRIMSVDKDSKDMEITQKDVEFLRCVTKDVIEGKVSFFFFLNDQN